MSLRLIVNPNLLLKCAVCSSSCKESNLMAFFILSLEDTIAVYDSHHTEILCLNQELEQIEGVKTWSESNCLSAHIGNCSNRVEAIVERNQKDAIAIKKSKQAQDVISLTGNANTYKFIQIMIKAYQASGVKIDEVLIPYISAADYSRALSYTIKAPMSMIKKLTLMPSDAFTRQYGEILWSPILLFSSYIICPLEITVLKKGDSHYSLNESTIKNFITSEFAEALTNKEIKYFLAGDLSLGVKQEETFTLFVVMFYGDRDEENSLSPSTTCDQLKELQNVKCSPIIKPLSKWNNLKMPRFKEFDDSMWSIKIERVVTNYSPLNIVSVDIDDTENAFTMNCNTNLTSKDDYNAVFVSKATLAEYYNKKGESCDFICGKDKGDLEMAVAVTRGGDFLSTFIGSSLDALEYCAGEKDMKFSCLLL